jgi:hypothetical protein
VVARYNLSSASETLQPRQRARHSDPRPLTVMTSLWRNSTLLRLICLDDNNDDSPQLIHSLMIDDARVTKKETLVRRGKTWFRYDAPDKRLFRELQNTLTAPE